MTNSSYILLVDDDGTDHIVESFYFFNLPIVQVENGKEALEVLRERQDTCYLMMTDYQMPEMFGHQLIKTANQEKIEIKNLILSTSYDPEQVSFEELKAEVREQYDLHFIQKGYTPDILDSFLREITGGNNES